MPKEYSISDLLALPQQHIPYCSGTFEGTEDPEIEWPHRHSFYSLVWFTQGSGFYVIDFEEYDIRPNRIFFVNPKQIHNWDYSENSKGYFITVDHSLEKDLTLGLLPPYLDIDQEVERLLKLSFISLIENYHQKENISIDIQYIYKQLERYSLEHQQTHNATNTQLLNFKKLISENIKASITIDKYAKRLQISEEKLNTLCKTHTGSSAKQYIIDHKIIEAKRQLIYTSLNINEISDNLGFEDSSYFARIFKKRTSITPSDFLKKYRKQG